MNTKLEVRLEGLPKEMNELELQEKTLVDNYTELEKEYNEAKK